MYIIEMCLYDNLHLEIYTNKMNELSVFKLKLIVCLIISAEMRTIHPPNKSRDFSHVSTQTFNEWRARRRRIK